MISVYPLIATLVCVIGAIIEAALSLKPIKRVLDSTAVLTSLTSLAFASLTLYQTHLHKFVVYGVGGWPPPIGIVYVVDDLSATFALLTTFVTLMVVLYSSGYFAEEVKGLSYYYSLLLLLESALLGCFYTGDAFNLFVMVELMAVCAYALVAHYREVGTAIEASLKYGLVAALAGIIYFIALSFVYGYLGTLSMPDIASKIIALKNPMWLFSGYTSVIPLAVLLIVILITWSFMIESAVFPAHFWLPDAHSEAPSPVSAMLSGLVVNVGLYILARFYYTVFKLSTLIQNFEVMSSTLVVIGSVGAVYAAIRMITQTDIKRLIAFSTVMHMSIIFIGIGLGTTVALTATSYHILAHSVSKSLAFLAAGLLIYVVGSRELSDLRGLGKIYPGISAALIISMLGLAGIPPLGTFPSKLLLIMASLQAKHYEAVFAIVISSALACVAYFRIVNVLINANPIKIPRKRIPLIGRFVVGLLAALTIAVGIFLPQIYGYLSSSVHVFVNTKQYIESVSEILRLYLSPR